MTLGTRGTARVGRRKIEGRYKLSVLASTVALVATVCVVPNTTPAQAATGDLVGTVDFSQQCGSGLGVGITFDGTNLWYSCYNGSPDLLRANPATGQVSASYNIAGGLGSLAYDARRNAIWAAPGGGSSSNNVYLISLDASHSVTGSQVAFSTCGAVCSSLTDGLAYDASDDSLYISPDGSTTIYHYSTTGTELGSFPWAGNSCYNSGVALGGNDFYEGSDGCNTVWVVAKSAPSTVLFSFSTSVSGDPNFRDESLTCDPNTFASQGKEVMWSKEAYSPMRAHAFEVPVGTCESGGLSFLNATEQLGSQNPSENNVSCSHGAYPVNCASGNFFHEFTDAAVPGRGPSLKLARTYNSLAASASSPFGYGWSSSYAMSLSIDPNTGAATVDQENGSTVSFSPNGSGGFVAQPRVLASLVKNADGTYTFIRRHRDLFTFSSAGQLVKESDLNGYSTTLTYNGSGQLATVTDAAGRSLAYAYSANGLVASVTDPAGNATTYTYDSTGNLSAVTDPIGRTTSFTYDANHLLLTMQDPRGGVTTNVYDSGGRVTTQTDPAGQVTSYSYAGNPFTGVGGTTTITDPHGNVETQKYADGELISLTKGSGTPTSSTWSYAYDPGTLGVTSVTDPDGHTATATYDQDGNRLSSTDALGQTTSFTYNDLDEQLTSTDPVGIVASNSYDAAGNLLAKALAGIGGSPVATTSYTYGDSSHPGDVTQVTDPDGHVTNFTYDAYGDVATTTTHPSSTGSDTTADVYDILGRKVCQASPNATVAGVVCPAAGSPRVADTSTWVYDADGEVTSTTDANAETTGYGYDADGDQTQTTDPLGNLTTTSYDADGRKRLMTAGSRTASAATTSDAYDLAYGIGACSAQVTGATYCTTTTSPVGAVTVDYLDAQDRQLVQVLNAGTPQAQTTADSYDAAGNLISQLTPSGTASDGYDADNRLTSVTYSSPASGYQAASNVSYAYNADGERTQMVDGTGTTSYSYDALGRLSSTTNGVGQTTGYAYDADNNITTLTYPNGQSISRAYDGAGEWSSVTDWQGHTTSFSYDHDGNLKTEGLANGLQAASSYNQNDAMLGTAVTRGLSTVDQATYSRNADSQVTNDAQCGSSTACYSQTYGYDPLARVSTLQEPQNSGPTYPYAYDAAGDLTGIPANTTQSYNAASEVTSLSQGIAQLGQIETATSAASASTLSVSLPSGIQTFDQILVAVFEVNTQTASTPAGYVSVGTFGSSTSGSERVQLFRRTAAGGESGVTVSFGLGATLGASIMASVYRGLDASDPIEQLSSGSTAVPSSTISVPSVTTALPNELLLLYQGASTTSSGSFSTAGMYEAAQVNTSGSSTGAGGLAEALQASPGASGARTVTFTSGEAVASMAGVLLSVRPSVSAFSYDSSGDRTSESTPGRPSPTMGYDQTGRLVSYTTSAGTDNYVYNGDGLRMQKNSEGYSWDVAEGTPEMLIDGSTSYVYGPGGLVLEQIQAPAIAYVNGTTYLDSLGTASSQTISLPSGTTPGDQVIVGVTEAQGETSSIAGYHSLGSFSQPSADRLDVYNHTVVPGDGSFAVSWQTNGSAHPKEVVVAVYSGVDPNTPVDAVTGAATSSSATTQSLGPLTISQTGEELVMVQSAVGNSPGVTWSGGMGERSQSTASQTLSASAVADEGPDYAGSTGPRYSTISGSLTTPQLAGALISLFPVQAYFYVHDQRGTTRMITDNVGNVIASYFYGPYGQNPAATGAASVLQNNPFTYEGQYTDTESGFVYLRARYYDPGTGQFLSVDPAVNVTGQPYAYAGDDPVNQSDPLGLYSYQFNWNIGPIADTGTPAKAFSYFETHARKLFPFSTGNCSTFYLGENCYFQPGGGTDWLAVSNITRTSLTLVTCGGWIDPAGSTIRFSFSAQHGNLVLTQTAHAPDASWWVNVIAPQLAYNAWMEMALNVSRALNGTYGKSPDFGEAFP